MTDGLEQNKTKRPEKKSSFPQTLFGEFNLFLVFCNERQHRCSTQKCSNAGLTCFSFIHRASFCPPHRTKLLHSVIPVRFTWFGSVLSHTTSKLAHQDCPRQTQEGQYGQQPPFSVLSEELLPKLHLLTSLTSAAGTLNPFICLCLLLNCKSHPINEESSPTSPYLPQHPTSPVLHLHLSPPSAAPISSHTPQTLETLSSSNGHLLPLKTL